MLVFVIIIACKYLVKIVKIIVVIIFNNYYKLFLCNASCFLSSEYIVCLNSFNRAGEYCVLKRNKKLQVPSTGVKLIIKCVYFSKNVHNSNNI